MLEKTFIKTFSQVYSGKDEQNPESNINNENFIEPCRSSKKTVKKINKKKHFSFQINFLHSRLIQTKF